MNYSLSPENVKNILVIRKHNQIGDMLCSLGMFAALKRAYPHSKITLVVSPTNYNIDFKEINPYVDYVLVYRKGTLSNILSFYRKLREKKYQIGIVPSTIKISDTSHLINYLSGARVRLGVKSVNGKNNKFGFLLNAKKDFNWEKTHQIERNLDVVRQIGCDLTDVEKNSIKIDITVDDLIFGNEFYSNHFPNKSTPVIAFHPGAGEKYRLWKTEYFIELIKRIYDKYKCYILITSGEIDKDIIGKIKNSEVLSDIDLVFAEGLAFKRLAAVLQKASLYITNNTGTLHIAHFAGTKTLALFTIEQTYDWAYKSGNENYVCAESINDIETDEVFLQACKMIEKQNPVTGTD